MKNLIAYSGFEKHDLENKSWDDVFQEISDDIKSQLLGQAKKTPVPVQLFANIIITYNESTTNNGAGKKR